MNFPSRIGIQRKRVEWPIADAASFLPEAFDPRPAPTCGASGLINNWEGTYFDFTAEKIEAMADEASTLGIELFVLDEVGSANVTMTTLRWVIGMSIPRNCRPA